MEMWDGVKDARELSRLGVEVWTPVHLAPERYFVSNLGRVKSNTRGKEFQDLQPTLTSAGRHTIGISREEGSRSDTQLVYRLVVHAFDGPPPSEKHTDVCHGFGGEGDDRLHNLRWGTRSENMRDVLRHRRAKLKDRVRPESERSNRQWYQGHTLDKDLLETGLRLYDSKKLTIEDLADLWKCSADVAANIARGEARQELVQLDRVRKNGRVGENHHAAVCTDAQLAEALQLYVDNHWSGVEFARHLNVSNITADSILKGGRNGVPRPEGFQYPWPDAAYMNKRVGEEHGGAKLTEAKIREVFDRIMSGGLKDMKDVQLALGVGRGTAYGLVGGTQWGHLPRPEGFAEAVAKLQRRILSAAEQKAIVEQLIAGRDRVEIMQEFDIDKTKLGYYVSKVHKMQGTGQRRLTKQQKDSAQVLIMQGLSWDEVKARLDFPLGRDTYYKLKREQKTGQKEE